jgi:RNA polymerase sigma-70 factor (ECF subfamily)
MDELDLATAFEAERPRLLAVATRALGSRADAEDAVQEAWIRLHRHGGAGIENLGGWLMRVTSRLCIDALRSRASRPVPLEPTVTEDVADGPEDATAAADAVGLALVVVLESLRPEERLAFVLHDLFAVPFAEIGQVVGRSADAAKMLASRARRKVQAAPRPTGERRERRAVVDAFLAAAREGDFDALLRLLDPDVTWHRYTARGHTVQIGANEVLAVVRRGDPAKLEARRVAVNGEPGILVSTLAGRPIALMSCTVADGRLVEIVSLLDPARLARLTRP